MLSAAYRRYVLVVMTAVYTLNLVDRTLISLFLQSIKDDLHLSDSELGLVTGIAFGLFYAAFGIPFGRWADRGNRVTLTSIAIGLWGLTVMACQLVINFGQLVGARIAGGIGEAGSRPPTYSLLGDYFPDPIERTRAMSIYFAGGPLSGLVGYFVGGWLGATHGWRGTFFIMGIPGLVLAVLVKATIAEPRVHGATAQSHEPVIPPVRAVLSTLWTHRALRHLSLALISLFIMSMGLTPWFAAFMVRSHHIATAELGIWFGTIFGLGGLAGALTGGYAATHWFPKNERAQMRMAAVSIAALTPCYVAFLTLPQQGLALLSLVPLVFVGNIFQGPAYTLMQRLVSDETRATTMAVVLFLMNLVGYAVGPQLVGFLSDALLPVAGTDSLRYAMLATSSVTLWSAFHFWKAGDAAPADLAAMGRAPAPTASASGYPQGPTLSRVQQQL